MHRPAKETEALSLADVLAEMREVNAMVAEILERQRSADLKALTPAEFGVRVGRAAYTVASWLRQGRINGRKNEAGDWVILFDELKRFNKEGLLKATRRSTAVAGAAVDGSDGK